MHQSVERRYEAAAQAGAIVPDERQRELARTLDELARSLQGGGRRSGGLRRLLSGDRGQRPRGLYIWGAIGSGKTLLMDFFHEAVSLRKKRRLHFHAFMADVHDRLDRRRRSMSGGTVREGDPLVAVAADIASEIELLCFDEFSVSDIADAMILSRLFEQLFARGVSVVATSNIAPDDLYKDGLNRSLFLPFIGLLKRHLTVFHLAAPRDYRLDAAGTERRYITPLGPEATACLDAHFRHLTGATKGKRHEIANKGRRITVPEAAEGVARFTFEELCARPLAASDYRKIAEAYPTLILADVPVLGPSHRNEAKRFINLIDTLYDLKARLIVSADAEPHTLWTGAEGVETAEFQRTASRLIEMRSDAYWQGSRAAVGRK
jgi:cell division protein ZapE